MKDSPSQHEDLHLESADRNKLVAEIFCGDEQWGSLNQESDTLALEIYPGVMASLGFPLATRCPFCRTHKEAHGDGAISDEKPSV